MNGHRSDITKEHTNKHKRGRKVINLKCKALLEITIYKTGD